MNQITTGRVENMSRQLKLIIVANALISLIFLVFNVLLWGNYYYLYLYPFHIHVQGPWFGDPIILPNLLFWLFWLSTGVNLYFIIRLQGSKESNNN